MTTTPPNSNDMKSSIEIPPQKTDENAKISRYAMICAVLWTLLFSGLFVAYVIENRKAVLEIGHGMGQATFENDVLFRRWADRSGGVYVPETAFTPANPYLSHIPERDVTTPSGKHLTLVNPAYMTRQVFELARELPNISQGHITSLNPIRPENAPDAWETQALKTLERGAKEVVEPVLMNGKPHLRIMRPLTTEKSCLSCHAAQGYKEGDGRGGISVTISLTPIQQAMSREMMRQAFIYLFIWLIGLGLIWFGARKIVRTMKLLDEEHIRLLNKERYQRALLDNFPFMVWLKDTESRFLAVNQMFTNSCGMGVSDELMGKNDYDIWPHDLAENYRADDQDVMASRQKKIVEEEILDHLVPKWFETYKIPVIGKNGKVLGTAGFARDITDRKQAEIERQQLEQQLHQAQKLESLGVLAGGIAHDFNNILAVIICNCSLAIQRPKMAEELIPEIETAAQRAAGLCRQMLAYAGKAQFVDSHVDVTALVDEVLSMLKSTLPQNVTIKSYLSGDMPNIKGDASQISQIAMNLIINASEAIGEDQGDIVVSLTKTTIGAEQPEKDHLGKTITDGPYICLEITDTGRGMDDETKQRIFEPFYTTKFVGRGLGMSAVLGIITSHKGALQLSSQLGQGTTFKVYLPVQISDSAVESLQQTTPAPWQGSGTILLVEDEPQLITVAKNLLESLGFSVIEASNGIEALEQYRKNASDITLVVTDIGMPIMNGYELIAELKKIDPTLPIIISSGFGDKDVTSKIALGDISGLISKPYRFDQLREVLKIVLEGV